jgi:hypothetical protein
MNLKRYRTVAACLLTCALAVTLLQFNPIGAPVPADPFQQAHVSGADAGLSSQEMPVQQSSPPGAIESAEEVTSDSTDDRQTLSFEESALGLGARFDTNGIEVTRNALDPSMTGRMALRYVGARRGSTLTPPGKRTLKRKGESVSLEDASTGVDEWFVRRDDGIEHGFTLAKRPPGTANELEMVLATNPDSGSARIVADSNSIVFEKSSGVAFLRYSGLYAWDSMGRALPARMETRGEQLHLVVDDSEAQYPVTIDPLITIQDSALQQFGVESYPFIDPPFAGSRLGSAVSADGDTVLVGAPGNSDSGVCVFIRDAAGAWKQQAKLRRSGIFSFGINMTSDPSTLGATVSLDANTAVAGSTVGGGVYVFVRAGTTWSRQAQLIPNDQPLTDSFGRSVAISGDTVIVGSPASDSSASAYVFTRERGVWSQQARLFPENPSIAAGFGTSVALDGDHAVVGAPRGTYVTPPAPGAAYLFERASGVWTRKQKLNGPVQDPIFDRTEFAFGQSVAIQGDVALIGSNPRVAPGAAFVYQRNQLGWGLQQTLRPSDTNGLDHFGLSVALDGKIAVVGRRPVYFFDPVLNPIFPDPIPQVGSAYVFERDGNSWRETKRLQRVFGESPPDSFGVAVSVSGDTVVIGDPSVGLAVGPNLAGSAYTYVVTEPLSILEQPQSRTVIPLQPVSFQVSVQGRAPVRYQWRKNGIAIPGANQSTLQFSAATEGDTGIYDVVVTDITGTAASAAATLHVNALSLFSQVQPNPVPAANGFILVNLSPETLTNGQRPGWRFVGEQQWRESGVPVGGLASGNRKVEFRPVPGWLHPLREDVAILSDAPATVVSREYFEGQPNAAGTLAIDIFPTSITNVARWRLLGESAGAWRSSGASLPGLAPGVYLIEFNGVAGFSAPQPLSVTVLPGQSVLGSATYLVPDASAGTGPSLTGFDSILAGQTSIATYVGQLRSTSGSGTGFVVRKRVVATAAHVVFDDSTLTAAVGLQWLFQRERGTYEPAPQEPRGSYILSGYAAQRELDQSPGVSSAASQNLDAAAVWFFEEEAGRGGSGGYLASDALDNEWLTSPRLKTIVGYPLDDILQPNQGRIHATLPLNATFSRANGRVFVSDDITSRGGNSGGPLSIEYDDGRYYPAAIYLGGTTQTRVRAIDGDVIALFDSAEESSNTGQNSTNGGSPLANNPGAAPVAGTLTVTLNPPEVRGSGAGWRIGAGEFLASGQSRPFLSAGTYAASFKSIAGYRTPAARPVTVEAGSITNLSATYLPAVAPVISGPSIKRLIRGNPVSFSINADFEPSLFSVSGLAGTGLQLTNPAAGVISGTPTTSGTFNFTATGTNEVGTSAPFSGTIIVAEPGELIVQADPTRGKVTVKPKSPGNIFPQGETVTLEAKPTKGFVFANWEFIGLDTLPSFTGLKTSFEMAPSVFVKADFIPNPFVARVGIYEALLRNAKGTVGIVSIVLNGNGTFTAKFSLNGVRYRIKGTLDGSGEFTGEKSTKEGTLEITLFLDVDDAESGISGTVAVDGNLLTFVAAPGSSEQTPAAEEGSHTLLLPSNPPGTDARPYPVGHGYAILNVKASGAVRAVGQLGDSTPFSTGGIVTESHEWGLYLRPYDNDGLLAGILRFSQNAGPGLPDTVEGALDWERPPGKGGVYSAGFGGGITAIGSRYLKPADNEVALTIQDWNLVFGTGVLDVPIMGTTSLDDTGRFDISLSTEGTARMSLEKSTGRITGSLKRNDGGAIKIKGALLLQQEMARGVFIFDGQAAGFSIDPPAAN